MAVSAFPFDCHQKAHPLHVFSEWGHGSVFESRHRETKGETGNAAKNGNEFEKKNAENRTTPLFDNALRWTMRAGNMVG